MEQTVQPAGRCHHHHNFAGKIAIFQIWRRRRCRVCKLRTYATFASVGNIAYAYARLQIYKDSGRVFGSLVVFWRVFRRGGKNRGKKVFWSIHRLIDPSKAKSTSFEFFWIWREKDFERRHATVSIGENNQMLQKKLTNLPTYSLATYLDGAKDSVTQLG